MSWRGVVLWGRHGTESPFASTGITRSPRYYGLMRQTSILCAPRSRSAAQSWQVAASPCWTKALPDVISAHPSRRAWTPTPAARVVPMPVSSHTTPAFPPLEQGRRSATFRTATSVRPLDFGAAVIPLCSGPQGCSPPRSLLPIRALRMAAVTCTSEPLVVRCLPTPRICLPSESGN